jgi:hypothetical protein
VDIDLALWEKPQSKLGKWLKSKKATQGKLQELSGVNKNTITSLCTKGITKESSDTIRRILDAAREIDSTVKYNDLF